MWAMLIELLSYGFMQRAIIAGLLIAVATGLMGVFALIRKGAFFGDAIAHSALAGVAFGVFLQTAPFLSGAVYAIIAAISLPLIQKKSRLSLDAVLGILLPVSMGLSVLIFSLLPGYQPELFSFLFGSILSVTTEELAWLFTLTFLLSIILLWLLEKMLMVSIDHNYAKIIGIDVKLIDVAYHFLLALSIIAGVKLVGVILVNALLVIPASIASQFAKSLKSLLILTPLLAVIITLLGILVSALLDTPSGATIAVVGGIIFILSIFYRSFLRRIS